jgi:hypothetical protein
MGEVVGFIPNAERERRRLIRQARALYESIFPSAPTGEQLGNASASDVLSGGNAHCSDEGLPS